VQDQKQFITIAETFSKVDESAKITGTALVAIISRNGNLYTKEELARFDNITVPLNWEHDSSKIIGTATFNYNPELETVFYEGEITDPAAAMLARNKLLFTSIEANPASATKVCNNPGECFSMPRGLQPVALALTETPGVTVTSVKVLESYLREHGDDLEKKYAPNQTNLKNEDHIEKLLLLAKEVSKALEVYNNEHICPDCGKVK
jgi:hypothetical protein